MPRGLPGAALTFALLAVAAPRPARAGAFEVQGFGPAGVAEVNARAARADDGTAAFYNPGGLGLGSGVRLEIAPTLAVSALSAQKKDVPFSGPFGVAMAFDATLPLTGFLKDRIRVGFGGYLMPSAALRLIAHKTDEPFFPYYDNRTQRLVLLPALAVRLVDGLAVGVAFNVLGGVSGPASVAPGPSGAPESRLDLQATTSLAVNAGIRYDPSPRVHLALAFRQQFAAPAVVNTTADIAGVPLKIDVTTHSALFDPTTIVAATSFEISRWGTTEIDASYAIWSKYQGPFVHVHAVLPGVDVASVLPVAIARDVVSLRAAHSYSRALGPRLELTTRVGVGFEPSMLKSTQQGQTNMVDADKILFGLGAALTIRKILPATVRVGAAFNVTELGNYLQPKRVCAAAPCPEDTVAGPSAAEPKKGIKNPGYPALEAGGSIWATSIGLGVDL